MSFNIEINIGKLQFFLIVKLKNTEKNTTQNLYKIVMFFYYTGRWQSTNNTNSFRILLDLFG